MAAGFIITARHWEPREYVDIQKKKEKQKEYILLGTVILQIIVFIVGIFVLQNVSLAMILGTTGAIGIGQMMFLRGHNHSSFSSPSSSTSTSSSLKRSPRPMEKLVDEASTPVGTGGGIVPVEDMFTGGSGSWNAVDGVTVDVETIHARYIINCAGGAADTIAKMIGDDSFTIKPRLGDYLLLNRNQGHLTKHTLFPTPDPILGKGVLVQTTLWGNLILGPTARDTYKPEMRDMSSKDVQTYILSKCKKLVPYFNPIETIHAFCGARAKSTKGDWIVGPSEKDSRFIHVAGIDSPGLAGSPAIALDVVQMLRDSGLDTPTNTKFNPNRAPIITPKHGLRGLKMGDVGKNDSIDGLDEKRMSSNVICKCEKVTELEVVRAMRRSLPIDSTQAIRKRTRAGMGHCQGDPNNYNCECRVKAIIARENGVSVNEVGGRPWPATSTLPQRWMEDDEKKELKDLMMKTTKKE